MSEAPHTPNTTSIAPSDDAKPSTMRRFAPLTGVAALMGTIVIAGSALASSRTAPEIDPSAVTVEASVASETSSSSSTSTATSTTRADDDLDDRDDYDDDLDDRHDDNDDVYEDQNPGAVQTPAPANPGNTPSPAYITPQVPLTYQDWDDDDWDDDDWDDDWDDDDWDDDNGDDD